MNKPLYYPEDYQLQEETEDLQDILLEVGILNTENSDQFQD